MADTKLYQYYLEAKIDGTTVTSNTVTRPKKTWMTLIKCDDTKLVFGDKKIFVPVPPGAFCKPAGSLILELALYKTSVNDLPAMTFRELIAANGRPPTSSANAIKVYHCNFTLHDMPADQDKSLTICLSKASDPGAEPPSEASYDHWGSGETTVTLACSLILRDRDYIRMCMTE